MILHIKRIGMEWNACRNFRDTWKWIFVGFAMKNVVIDNEVIDKQAIGVYIYEHGELI